MEFPVLPILMNAFLWYGRSVKMQKPGNEIRYPDQIVIGLVYPVNLAQNAILSVLCTMSVMKTRSYREEFLMFNDGVFGPRNNRS